MNICSTPRLVKMWLRNDSRVSHTAKIYYMKIKERCLKLEILKIKLRFVFVIDKTRRLVQRTLSVRQMAPLLHFKVVHLFYEVTPAILFYYPVIRACLNPTIWVIYEKLIKENFMCWWKFISRMENHLKGTKSCLRNILVNLLLRLEWSVSAFNIFGMAISAWLTVNVLFALSKPHLQLSSIESMPRW